MTRPHHITHILNGLTELIHKRGLLPQERTTLHLAIAEIEAKHPARVTQHDLDTAPCEVEPRHD